MNGHTRAVEVLESSGWQFWSNETGNADIYVHEEATGHSIHVQVPDAPDLELPMMDPGFWLHFGPGDLWNAGGAGELRAWLARFTPTMFDKEVRL